MFEKLELGPRQRATVAAAVTLGSAMVLLMVFSAAVWGLGKFASAFKNVLMPPVVAGILTIMMRPYYNWLFKVLRKSRAGALIVFFLSALVPLGALFWAAAIFAINQTALILDDLPYLINSMQEAVKSYWPQFMELLDKYELMQNPGEMAADALREAGIRMMNSAAQISRTAAGFLSWAVLPVYIAFFLMAEPFKAKQIGDFLPFLKKETRKDVIYLVDQFINILLTFFRGQIIIALIQGVLYAAGFALVGLPYGIFMGLALGFFNIIPYLGSIAGLLTALPLAYFGGGGDIIRVVLVLAVFSLVQAFEGYFLTPKIMGERTSLHPVLIIFAIFFWGAALEGILGMMLAIPLTAFAVVFWRLLKKKYIKEIV
ncbi:MAG: AI-2E family transporter [Spirochaetia bacterium]|jgi:predicted PurR-regulated permease PerM|nr:AI-2E family transporter [Spirochaetia bacterium]